MQFDPPLIQGHLLRRYKRFLTDVRLADGREVTAHCPNPGSMRSLLEEDAEVWLSPNDDPKRKLKFGWELVRARGALVGLNTNRANALVAEALAEKRVPEVAAYETVRPEVRYGANSRVDFLLSGAGLPDCYLEVKSVTMSREEGLAEFPDSVTARGAKHLHDLAAMVGQGHRAVLFFLIQRADCQEVAVAADIDAYYDESFATAVAEGVEVLAYSCKIEPTGLLVADPVPLKS